MENNEQIFTGAIKDIPDNRDFKYGEEIGYASTPFDWNIGYDIESELGFQIPSKDQGNSYSCGGQAFGYYAAVLEAFETKKYDEKSAKFSYAQVFVIGGGSSARPLAELYKNKGICSEYLCVSYEGGNVPSEEFMERVSDITTPAFENALTSHGILYSFPNTSIDSVAQALRDNHGVVIGITGTNNGTWRTEFPVPPTNFSGAWNHWVYAGKAKLINGIKYIGIKNSWGDNTGNKGWQWIPESYFTHDLVWCVIALTKFKKISQTEFHHTFLTDMVFGSRGEEVVALQKALILEGLLHDGLATGYFGTLTLRAVMAFQDKYRKDVLNPVGLGTPSGKVLQYTRAKLNQLYSK